MICLVLTRTGTHHSSSLKGKHASAGRCVPDSHTLFRAGLRMYLTALHRIFCGSGACEEESCRYTLRIQHQAFKTGVWLLSTGNVALSSLKKLLSCRNPIQ
ncbi:hypothetical protein SRHO_G00313500 [Serrasalmus rhombeus]